MYKEDCIFCKIVQKKISANIVYEDELCLGFKDINPVTPVHILFIPKKHITSLDEVYEEDVNLIGHVLLNISKYARKEGLVERGYRVVNNIGKDAGQSVFHIHFHLLAGRRFSWPPG
jgi:histidine triad (HIT) family protein